MKVEKKLMSLDLQKENKKNENFKFTGVRLHLFRLFDTLLTHRQENLFLDIAFVVAEFLQLMAFLYHPNYATGEQHFFFGPVSHCFRYLQLFFLWDRNSQFYIASFVGTLLNIFCYTIMVLYAVNRASKYMLSHNFLVDVILLGFTFEKILNIPIVMILLSVFDCDNLHHETNAPDIDCNSGVHIGMIVFAVIFLILYVGVFSLFHKLMFEYPSMHYKINSMYSSHTMELLFLSKIVMTIVYEFVKDELVLAIITSVIAGFLLFDYVTESPFYHKIYIKLYLCLFACFFWTSLVALMCILLKRSQFRGGVILLLLGYAIIVLCVCFKEVEYSNAIIFQNLGNKYRSGYTELKEIELFLKLESSFDDGIRGVEQKILQSYASNYERTCTLNNCALKKYWDYALNSANLPEMRIHLIKHAETRFKNDLTKYPLDSKLRLSNALFLYKKLGKKQQGVNELLLLKKYAQSFEDSFLIFRAQNFIEDSGFKQEKDSQLVDSVVFKSLLKNIKNLIGKIVFNYIDFWTILAISDETKSENFQKMSRIGTRISVLNDELLEDINRLERVNLYDLDTTKLYYQYLSEILNNSAQANVYFNILSELDTRKHQYNETHMLEMNYKIMARSEEYKYMVLSLQAGSFQQICNLSLNLCRVLGFAREELVGRNLDCVLPEIACFPHRKNLRAKIEDFKKAVLISGRGQSLKTRGGSKTIETFGRNKMKYLVPLKMKLTLVSSEDGNIYAVAKFFFDTEMVNSEFEEKAYILTDNDLVIQNFSSNVPKILKLSSNAMANNVEIIDNFRELHDEFMREINNYSEVSEENEVAILYKRIKIDVLNRVLDKKGRVLTWVFGSGRGKLKKHPRKVKESFVDSKAKKKRFKSATGTYKGNMLDVKNIEKVDEANNSRKKKAIMAQYEVTKRLSKAENRINLDMIKLQNTKTCDVLDSNYEESCVNDKSRKGSSNSVVKVDVKDIDKFKFERKQHNKFLVNFKELLIGKVNVGYIFTIEIYDPSKEVKDEMTKIVCDNNIEDAKSAKEYKQQMGMSFCQANINIDELQVAPDFVPALESENEFVIDVSKMAYKQWANINKAKYLYSKDVLREEAFKKLEKMNLLRKQNAEESSEESSESSYTSENSINSESHLSLKNEISLSSPVNKANNTPKNTSTDKKKDEKDEAQEDKSETNTGLLTGIIKKQFKYEEEYYHVNVAHITYFVYNYNTHFVEAIKDTKFKISTIAKTLQFEKEKISRGSTYYAAAGSREKKSKSSNSKNSRDEEEKDLYSEKKIKLREIDKALNSKEKQASIVNLCIFSFVIFVIVIGSSFCSIIVNSFLKNHLFIFYNLIEKSLTLYRNLLFEINLTRELLLISDKLNMYTNLIPSRAGDAFFAYSKAKYYENISQTLFEHFLDTSFTLSNLSSARNALSSAAQRKINSIKGRFEVIDGLQTAAADDFIKKTYELNIYSSFRELNAALYHITQTKMADLEYFNDNVYYFMKNAMNSMLVIAETQIDDFTHEFHAESGLCKVYCYVIMAVYVVAYAVCYVLFIVFYHKVEERKQSYLSVFYDIGNGFIVNSLSKCEKFSMKIQMQDELINQGEKVSVESTTLNSNDFNDLLSNEHKTNKNNAKHISSKVKQPKKVSHYLTNLVGFLFLFSMLVIQLATYFYYSKRITLYQNFVYFSYFNNQYNRRYLLPFISLREYLFDPNKTFYLQKNADYVHETLETYYTDMENITRIRDVIKSRLPADYVRNFNRFYQESLCTFIEPFLADKTSRNINFRTCDGFLYNASNYGLESMLATYIEDLRLLRDTNTFYINEARKMGFVYNHTLVGTKFEIKVSEDKIEEYRKMDPMRIFNDEIHKNCLILYKYMLMTICRSMMDYLFSALIDNFNLTIKVGLIINVVFIGLVCVGFFGVWVPFILDENEIIYKTKNMLSIIPKEVLLALPHINVMLGINSDS